MISRKTHYWVMKLSGKVLIRLSGHEMFIIKLLRTYALRYFTKQSRIMTHIRIVQQYKDIFSVIFYFRHYIHKLYNKVFKIELKKKNSFRTYTILIVLYETFDITSFTLFNHPLLLFMNNIEL